MQTYLIYLTRLSKKIYNVDWSGLYVAPLAAMCIIHERT